MESDGIIVTLFSQELLQKMGILLMIEHGRLKRGIDSLGEDDHFGINVLQIEFPEL